MQVRVPGDGPGRALSAAGPAALKVFADILGGAALVGWLLGRAGNLTGGAGLRAPLFR